MVDPGNETFNSIARSPNMTKSNTIRLETNRTRSKAIESNVCKSVCKSFVKAMYVKVFWVLIGWVPDFEHRKKPKGGPLEIEKNFVEGG